MGNQTIFNVVVTNDKPLIDAMGQLADKVKNKVARASMMPELRRMLPLSRRIVQRKSGDLARSLTTSYKNYTRKGYMRLSYGPRKERTVQDIATGNYGVFRGRMNKRARAALKVIRDPMRYAHLVEFGTKAHTVKAKGPYMLRDKKSGQTFGRKVTIKAKPYPFMGNMFEQNKASAQVNIRRRALQLIDQEVRNAAANSP